MYLPRAHSPSDFPTKTTYVGDFEITHASGRQQKSLTIPDAVFTVSELLMMGGKTA
jgi:hypothetical protein